MAIFVTQILSAQSWSRPPTIFPRNYGPSTSMIHNNWRKQLMFRPTVKIILKFLLNLLWNLILYEWFIIYDWLYTRQTI